MNNLVFLACKMGSPECFRKCTGDCAAFWRVKEKLEKFGEEISRGLRGKEIIITELRKEEWYKMAVDKLHWNGYVIENNAFKKEEEELVNGLLGMWAQK